MISVRSNWPVLGGVDAEVGGQLHRAAHALGHVDERAVGEHRGVQRREEVVALRHHRAEILPHQLRVLLHRLGDRAEDDAELAELLLEGGRDRDAVEHVVHRDAGQHLLLAHRDAELLVGAQQLGIDLGQALRPVGFGFGRGVVADRLVVDRRVARPSAQRRLLHRRQRASALSRHSIIHAGSPFLAEMKRTIVLVQALGRDLGLDLGDEAVLVLVAACSRAPCPALSPSVTSPSGPRLSSAGAAKPRGSRPSALRQPAVASLDASASRRPPASPAPSPPCVMPSSAPRIASLIRCQLARAGHSASISQSPGPSSMHAVSAIGPSSATITSATLIAARRPRQPVAALGAAVRDQQPGARQRLQDLARHRQRDVALRRRSPARCAAAPAARAMLVIITMP